MLPPKGELGRLELTGAPVFELALDGLSKAGRYRVCVDAIGCTHTFEVSDTASWGRALGTVIRGAMQQRSGIELGHPVTPIARPRPYHPDDAIDPRQSTVSLLETANGPVSTGEDQFGPLKREQAGEPVPDAWGGHFDAGDWDRRVFHLNLLTSVLDLVELYPDVFADFELGLPESGDGIPDILDEGLWDLDLYRRLQLANGAIRGGIEATEHPQSDTTSWTEELDVRVYAPDVYASVYYAKVAAQAGMVITAFDPERGADYLASAIAAMDWVQGQPVPTTREVLDEYEPLRAVAAASLFRATGDRRWHDMFLGLKPKVRFDGDILECHRPGWCDAGVDLRSNRPCRHGRRNEAVGDQGPGQDGGPSGEYQRIDGLPLDARAPGCSPGVGARPWQRQGHCPGSGLRPDPEADLPRGPGSHRVVLARGQSPQHEFHYRARLAFTPIPTDGRCPIRRAARVARYHRERAAHAW